MSDTPEKNYYPITESSSTKEGTPEKPQANMSNAGQVVNIDKSSVSNSNIVTIAGGSLLKSGYFQSSNYVKGLSGFFINSDGSVEFGDGEFRGEITATSGAIGGFVIGADYLRDVSNSFGLSSTVTGGNDVRFWAGSTFANRATAPLRIYEDGSIYGTNVTLTGAMNATSGWIGSATALVYESQGINTGVTGFIRGGQTSFNTGIGYFLGYDIDKYKLSIGNATSGNYLNWDGTDLIVNDSKIANQDIFGDGSDGDVVISSDTDLSRDTFYDNLTIDAGYNLNPNGYRIFVKDTLIINATATISRNGNDGSDGSDGVFGVSNGAGGSGGSALADGSMKGAIAGGNGSTYTGGTDPAGTSINKSLGNNGAKGGNGGNSGNNFSTGNVAGIAGVITGTVYNFPRTVTPAYMMYDFIPSGEQLKSSAGSTGGGGSNGPGRGGGGGGAGSPGGILVIFSRKLINNGVISCKGGNGADGGAGGTVPPSAPPGAYDGGGGGGGAGGSGGFILIAYNSKTGSGTIVADGGNGGNGGAKGTGGGGNPAAQPGGNGQDGLDGNSIQLEV